MLRINCTFSWNISWCFVGPRNHSNRVDSACHPEVLHYVSINEFSLLSILMAFKPVKAQAKNIKNGVCLSHLLHIFVNIIDYCKNRGAV